MKRSGQSRDTERKGRGERKILGEGKEGLEGGEEKGRYAKHAIAVAGKPRE